MTVTSKSDCHLLRRTVKPQLKFRTTRLKMQLYFIRHGQSINNANSGNPEYLENSDPFLTETGLEQAEVLAKYLKEKQHIGNNKVWNEQNQYGFGLTHIYTSLMERAVATAAPTVRALETVPFSTWIEIYEEGGIYTREKENRFNGLPGKPRSFYEKNFPELKLPDSYKESGWWNRPFEGDGEERQLRANKVFADLIARHGDREGRSEERIAFVSHGGFFVRLVSAMLKLNWRQAAHGMKSWFYLNNCSISRFDINKEEITICYMNRVDHLPTYLITG
jgi:2,3-bisphosphoglycerate-dependent phosphoglycerate mutase